MKKLLMILSGVMSMSFSSCLKVSQVSGSAALNIVNAITNSSPIVTNFIATNGKGQLTDMLQYYSTATQIPYTGYWESGSYTGSTEISISQISDTLLTIWSGRFNLSIGSIHTLFLCGDTTKVDTLFTNDKIQFYQLADSISGVRFVNLSQGSLPMTINISGNPGTQSEYTNLSYKSISNFKAYSANSSVPGFYNFEIRDQAADSLLTTFTWTYTLQKSNTIVISGSENSGLNVFQINNF